MISTAGIDGNRPLERLRRTTGKRLMSGDGRFSSRALFPFGEPRKVARR